MKANSIQRSDSPFAVALLGLMLCAPGISPAAETTDGDWHYRAAVYGFFPDINGQLRAPVPGGGSIDVEAHDLIDRTQFAAMGGFEAQKGKWGLFTDVIYMDVGDSISDSPTVGKGNLALPPGVTADASLDIKAVALTMAANYRVIDTPTDTFDVMAGARMLDVNTELEWQFDSPLGPLPPPQGQGSTEVDRTSWDGIVGVKGRHSFGARNQWFVPYYVDVGVGESNLTWQAATGIGYAAGWGDTFLVWRRLDYDFGRSRQIEDLSFEGPAIGVAFNW